MRHWTDRVLKWARTIPHKGYSNDLMVIKGSYQPLTPQNNSVRIRKRSDIFEDEEHLFVRVWVCGEYWLRDNFPISYVGFQTYIVQQASAEWNKNGHVTCSIYTDRLWNETFKKREEARISKLMVEKASKWGTKRVGPV